ncbi:hypothetical protein [Deinococcus cellulosilyticus]|uniref:Uncharacterized protein n=1 Tax=Deinococcus cellulosilyticus (strain DSM 18568 / NBRC 106333 / KACC 11606 / 5516J-15) TaxID=1223518 RepID=A0A511NAQ8_DEIC1|nr:hypothetical protein [Deinococcus cellulosilyticus]GEM49915.1 hypothetical protein DC3_55500 [Deinococcus cellulosilyticus NBRC 106333 = KACC 11606]
MKKQHVGARVDPNVREKIEKIAQANKLSVSTVVEELLIRALDDQESELAATFLIPKMVTIVDQAMYKHFNRMANLMVRTAMESSISAQMLQEIAQKDLGMSRDEVKGLRNEMWGRAASSLKRKIQDLTDSILEGMDGE